MFRSIRWQLPFSYALIAFFTAALLGALLLTYLRTYYAEQELGYLRDNAIVISQVTGYALQAEMPVEQMQGMVNRFAFLTQVHVRVISSSQQVIAESSAFSAGSPAAIQWTSAIDGSRPVDTEPVPRADVFNITVMGAGTSAAECVPTEESSCPIMIQRDENAMGIMQAGVGGNTLVTSAMPSQYGFELGRHMPAFSPRSDQIVQQFIFDPTTGTMLGSIVLSDGPAYGSEIVDGVTNSFILAGTAAVTLAAVAGWGISHNMSRPLLALAQTTERMARGDLSARVNITRRQDEIGTLADGFNGMAFRVEEMVNTLRRFIADAAHELNTPLTALHTNLELVAAEDISAHSREIVYRAQAQLKRLEALTKGLLHLSRLESGSLRENITPVNLTTFTHETAATFASQAEQAGVTLDIQVPNTALTLTADASQLQSALGNLLDNAIKFTPEGGTVSIKLAQVEQWAEIRVRDTGIGITNEDIPFLFERFYRGHNVSEYSGSGLGLSIVQAVAEHYGGKINVLAMTPGTEFSLYLPIRAS